MPTERGFRPGQAAAHAAIRTYQLTVSSLVGRSCRYLPTCSAYADEAIGRHGVWAGSWMGLGRLCRCHPWGGAGYDPVPADLPDRARWFRPWDYARWRAPPVCEAVAASPEAEPASTLTTAP